MVLWPAGRVRKVPDKVLVRDVLFQAAHKHAVERRRRTARRKGPARAWHGRVRPPGRRMSGRRGPRRRVPLILVSVRRRGRRRAWRVERRSELRRDARKAIMSRIAIRAERRRRDLHVRHDIGEPRRVKELARRREWRRMRPCIALTSFGIVPTIALLVIVAQPCIAQRRKQAGGCRAETRWLCAHEDNSAESACHARADTCVRGPSTGSLPLYIRLARCASRSCVRRWHVPQLRVSHPTRVPTCHVLSLVRMSIPTHSRPVPHATRLHAGLRSDNLVAPPTLLAHDAARTLAGPAMIGT